MQGLEVDARIFQRRDEPELALLAFQKQVLGVRAGNLAAQRARIFHREQRRMLDGLRFDAERGKMAEESPRGSWP